MAFTDNLCDYLGGLWLNWAECEWLGFRLWLRTRLCDRLRPRFYGAFVG